MTKEEAIEALQKFVNGYEKNIYGEAVHQNGFVQAIKVVISALRPITREQVEKVFSGCPACNDRRCTSCWCFGRYEEVCRKCENQSGYQPLKFCPHCGKPLRDEAVDMVMERMEALHSETKTD